MKKMNMYDWIAVVAGALVFLAYLCFMVYSFHHYDSLDLFLLTDQTDMVWMDALTKESQLLLRFEWLLPYGMAIALILLLLTKRYGFLALYAGLVTVVFAIGTLVSGGEYWGYFFSPLLQVRKMTIVFALYFAAKLVLVIRKEKVHLPDKATVFAKRIHEERRTRKMTQEEVAEKLHMSRSTVSRLETGVTPPVEETIAAFAALYEIPANELTDVPIPPGEEDARAFAIFGLLLSLGYSLPSFGLPLVFCSVIYSAYRRFSKSLIVFGIVVLLLAMVMCRFFLPAIMRLLFR